MARWLSTKTLLNYFGYTSWTEIFFENEILEKSNLELNFIYSDYSIRLHESYMSYNNEVEDNWEISRAQQSHVMISASRESASRDNFVLWIDATIHKSVYTFDWFIKIHQRSPKFIFWRDVPSIFRGFRTSPSSFLIFSFHFETPRISHNQLVGSPSTSISMMCCIVHCADCTRAVINLVDKAFQVYCFCYFS